MKPPFGKIPHNEAVFWNFFLFLRKNYKKNDTIFIDVFSKKDLIHETDHLYP